MTVIGILVIVIGIPLLIWLAVSRNRKIDRNSDFQKEFEKEKK